MINHIMGNNEHQFSDKLSEAVRLHQQGDREKARRIYLRLLGNDPQNSDALHLLGVIAYQEKRFEEAQSLISRAIRLTPEQASYFSNLGNAYRANNCLSQAAGCYQKAIDLNPEYADAYYNLGNTLLDQGKFDAAVRNYQNAARLEPNLINAYLNIGLIFELQGMPAQAISSYKCALQIKSDSTEACIRLGSAFQKSENHAKAIPYFQKAVAANPDENYRLFNNLGVAHQKSGNISEAIKCFEEAVNLNPDYANAYYNLGIGYQLNGELDQAIRVLQKALALIPDYSDAINLLVHLLQRTCDWHKLETYVKKMVDLTDTAIRRQTSTAEAVYTNVCIHQDPALNFSLACSRSRDIAAQATRNETNFYHNKPSVGFDKIILGYFSADFRNHPVAQLIRGVFKLHDRDAFKVCCYSFGKDDGSIYRSQIMRDCDHFVDLQSMNSREIACRLNEDKVSILIDLMGHTSGNKMEVCAMRPAPVQVTYLGFPGTTGAEFFDYIITDKIVSPLNHKAFYSEKFVYMPHCYQVNSNVQEIADLDWRRSDVGLPDDKFVFSSFNQPVKIEPLMFDCWMKILNRVPESVLWLLWDNSMAENNLRQTAQNRGVNPGRLIFAPKLAKEEHLARMQLVNLALDTRVYNGHTTTSDSLWAGIPVVTLLGSHFASRVSASILSAIGMPDLITHDLKEYEDLAVYLASNGNQLIQLRQKLRTYRKTKPLFDTPRFVQGLEQAYQTMWQIFVNGEKPRQIEALSDGRNCQN